MVKAIIFDCFGVVISDALSVIYSELGVTDEATLQQISDVINATNHGFMPLLDGRRQIAGILGIPPEEYNRLHKEGEVKDTTLLAYIAKLRRTYKTAMLSNVSDRKSLDSRFEKGELSRYFDAVVASGDTGFAKPEAQAYEQTAKLLGVRLEECIFLDDRPEYCEGARSVGMQAVLYQNFAQAKAELEALLA